MNGYGISNYNTTPKGFDHIDAIVSDIYFMLILQ